MITHLEPWQEAKLPEYRDKWLEIGLSTEPANWDAAEEGVRESYRRAGLDEPRYILRAASPQEGCLLAAIVSDIEPHEEDRLLEIVEERRNDESLNPRSFVNLAIPGQHQAGILCEYDIMANVLGIEDAHRLDGLAKVAMNAGWWWAYERCAIVTDRPSVLARDNQQRLHGETGPAIGYRDGFAIYAWHGTTVPADLIEDGWDAKRIMAERNTEIRRCAIERIGWDEFIVQAGLNPVSDQVNDPGNPGKTLQLFDIPRDVLRDEVRVMLCTNASPERDGTRRRFGLTVPEGIDDPVEAAAWSFGVPREMYAQLQRAC